MYTVEIYGFEGCPYYAKACDHAKKIGITSRLSGFQTREEYQAWLVRFCASPTAINCKGSSSVRAHKTSPLVLLRGTGRGGKDELYYVGGCDDFLRVCPTRTCDSV